MAKKFLQVFPKDVTENPNEIFGQPNTKNSIQFYLNLHTIALGEKTLSCSFRTYWDSHIHLSFYKNCDFKYVQSVQGARN